MSDPQEQGLTQPPAKALPEHSRQAYQFGAPVARRFWPSPFHFFEEFRASEARLSEAIRELAETIRQLSESRKEGDS